MVLQRDLKTASTVLQTDYMAVAFQLAVVLQQAYLYALILLQVVLLLGDNERQRQFLGQALEGFPVQTKCCFL